MTHSGSPKQDESGAPHDTRPPFWPHIERMQTGWGEARQEKREIRRIIKVGRERRPIARIQGFRHGRGREIIAHVKGFLVGNKIHRRWRSRAGLTTEERPFDKATIFVADKRCSSVAWGRPSPPAACPFLCPFVIAEESQRKKTMQTPPMLARGHKGR